MSVNSSSTFSRLQDFHCDLIVVHIRTLKTVLLLPLCTFILYLALQRWRRRRSFESHSDLFTYHLAVLELVWVFGFFSSSPNVVPLSLVGLHCMSVGYYGEIIVHALTCVERYLAVVHPVTYLSLKTTRGLRIRRILMVGVWLLSSGLTCLDFLIFSSATIPLLSLVVVSIVVTSFCSLSVLCVLIGPAPGGGERERVDQSKRRAFHTILVLWSMLCLWFLVLLVELIQGSSSRHNETVCCLTKVSLYGLNVVNSLVLPLLYLHREGKPTGCRRKRR